MDMTKGATHSNVPKSLKKGAADSIALTTSAPAPSTLAAASNQPSKQTQTQLTKRDAGVLESDDLASTFVDRVLSMIGQLKEKDPDSSNYNIYHVLKKEFVERTLIAKEEFHRAGKPTMIDVGYHYTKRENMASIRKEGLLSMTERSSKRISAAKEHGAVYGNGIYTGSNPCAYHGKYGDVGLMVARLVGINSDHGTSTRSTSRGPSKETDSVTVARNHVKEMMILTKSEQCIPVLQFDASQIVPNDFGHPGNLSLSTYHNALQRIIDDMLETEKCAHHVGAKRARVASRAASQVTPAPVSHQVAQPRPSQPPSVGPLVTATPQHAAQVPPVAVSKVEPAVTSHQLAQPQSSRPKSHAPSTVTTTQQAAQAAAAKLAQAGASQQLAQPQTSQPKSIAPSTTATTEQVARVSSAAETQQATTPQRVASGKLSYMAPETLGFSLTREVRVSNPSARKCACPTCSKTVGIPRGDMPSGEMTVSRTEQSCTGNIGFRTIVIDYNIPRGVQKMYHPNPGVEYKGTCRRAFLPETAEGCALLKRLKCAYQLGLTFSVGVSLASLRDNSVIWSSIPHKTSLTGGASRYGFPDVNYIANCNNELDKLNVPQADDLYGW
jgi:deltex